MIVTLVGTKGGQGRSTLAVRLEAWLAVAGHRTLVVDLSLAKVARGKVMLASQRGEPIPEGWAIDAEGRPTTDADAASTFNAIRDVVDSVESSFDSVYETVMSWGPSSAPAASEPEPVDVDEEEGQLELEPAEAPPPDRRRAILQYDDEYYSDYFAAAPEAAVEDYDYGEAGAGPVGAPAPAPGPYGG